MSELVELTDAPAPPGPRLTRLADLLAEADADARNLYESKQSGRAQGPVTNLPRLDREIGGAFTPGVHILLGQPGAGKSALALQVAASCACPCLFITCEMRPIVLLKRLAARVTQTYLGRFSTGEMRPEEAGALYRRAARAAPDLALLDATTEPADIRTILQAAEQTRLQDSHLLIVLDSLHSYAEALPGDSTEYDRLNAVLAGLRSLGARLACPVLAVAERNRAGMKGGLSAGAGSRKIEYGAETLISLDTDPDAKEDTFGEKAVTLKLEKNRSGTAGRELHLMFSGRLQQFREDAQ